jgi:Toastrack DUF4097
MRRDHLCSAITLAFLLAGCARAGYAAPQQGSSSGDVFTWSGVMSTGSTLAIRNFNGRIDVRAGAGNRAEVRAEKLRHVGGSRDLTFEAHENGGDVSVCSVWRGHSACDHGRGSDWDDDDDGRDTRASITVTLPRGVSLRGVTGNGEVTVDGTGGDLSIATGNGEIRIDGTSGTVRVSTGNGDVEVAGAQGEVTASTGNGRVHVTTGRGPVSASTGNGDITVAMSSIADMQDMRFTTGHGNVDVTVPGNVNADFDASTGWGSIRTDFPIRVEGSLNPRHIRGTIGRGGPRIHISSGFGSVELHKAN